KKVMQSPERAYPTAKDAPEHQREGNDDQRPRKAAIHGVRAEQRHGGNERVSEQEGFHWQRQANGFVCSSRESAPECGLSQEVEEQEEEADLGYPPEPDEPANRTPCWDARTWSPLLFRAPADHCAYGRANCIAGRLPPRGLHAGRRCTAASGQIRDAGSSRRAASMRLRCSLG